MTDTCPPEILSRSLQDMLTQLHDPASAEGLSTRKVDGWSHPVPGGLGFRYEYDGNVAKGGWEFYELHNGICIALVNMVARRQLARSHRCDDYLALSAVLNGNVRLADAAGTDGELADGYCTVYGTGGERSFDTLYEAGDHLRWVTLYFERRRFFDLTGLAESDIPADLGHYIREGGDYPVRNVPLSELASLTAHQLISPPFARAFRGAFMSAKALELACHILFGLAQPDSEQFGGRFEAEDHRRLKRAMQMIRGNIDQQISVHEIAEAVGMTRHRLQIGFRMIYGETVGRIRDKLRMELALDLIRDSKMSMMEIALETGYEHAASFTRAFKAAFGVSPIQMRKVANDELRVRHLASSLKRSSKPVSGEGNDDA
ncbi:MAG: AraC family transcriptional regulator [Pseudomonadota bacterium]|jgi:AraC-like DNA-binding protein|uniref:Transcriptional regulator, AraC family n=1 Tax=hydrothermal vent metagenome TaxID=652676 RepID=A0A160TKH5_9ZZZZ